MTRTPLVLLLAASACTPQDGIDDPDEDVLPTTYAFTRNGVSTVSYEGQTTRHVLIADLADAISARATSLGVTDFPVAGDLIDDLSVYLDMDDPAYVDLPHGRQTTPPALQRTYADLSTGKNLADKIAGQDALGQHQDWSVAFAGWTDDRVTTPLSLVRAWISDLDDAGVAWSTGTTPLTADGTPVPAFYITPEGHHLGELLEKFLWGAVCFSQAADDYLDDDVDGSGLRADHAAPLDGEAFTALEHAWDEGFGYFGAAATMGSWTDEQVLERVRDVDGDGAIDLLTEAVFGFGRYAAQRDLGSSPEAPVDFTADAWEGFVRGRALLANTDGPLDEAQAAELARWRDQALTAWEASMAATAVHYLNDVLVDMSTLGTEDYDLEAHATHWSELKGFALGFQFNPRSPMNEGDRFATLHELIGQAPVLGDAGEDAWDAARADLLQARDLLGDAYDFDAANLGDDDGTNGW